MQAIEGEKKIKGWSRAKKIALIEANNPQWKDLAHDWFAGASRISAKDSSVAEPPSQ
jgi:putative endonuclease